jgi:uncharacterized membrane protein
VPKLFAQHARLWLSTLAGIGVGVAMPDAIPAVGRVLIGWNAGVLLLLVWVYTEFPRLDARRIRSRYIEEDPSAPLILLIVICAALLSLVAIVALLSTIQHARAEVRTWHVALAALTIASSWMLVATMFTVHYADVFYSAPAEDPPLLFPKTEAPLFWDFAYFSFTIAAACQTSDVATAQLQIRKIVIAQTVVSFLFNVSILGFAINVTASLVGGS